jgi:hypothetical protein
MSSPANLSLLDVVTLNHDLPEHSLAAGAIGTIVEVFTVPDEAFEVEFCDSQGCTKSMMALRQDQITLFAKFISGR